MQKVTEMLFMLASGKPVFTLASETEETNISNEHKMVKNPNRQEADQFSIYKS